jgi:hypothetical protein
VLWIDRVTLAVSTTPVAVQPHFHAALASCRN